MDYSKEHWHSDIVPDKWQIQDSDYQKILPKVLSDFTLGKSKQKIFYRIAGLSGSGKSTQLLPAVTAKFESLKLDPVLTAARIFVPYHPYAAEIEQEFGSENLRENTNEFSTIMLFLTVMALIKQGYAIILDVSFFNPLFEQALMATLAKHGYEAHIELMAVSKEITEGFIQKRASSTTHTEKKRKVNRHTTEVFYKCTLDSLDYYNKNYPDTHINLWSAWDLEPVYSGLMNSSAMKDTYLEYNSIKKLPHLTDEVTLLAAKIAYLTQN